MNRRDMLAGTLAGAAGVAVPGAAARPQIGGEVESLLGEIRDLVRGGIGAQYSAVLLQLRQAMHAHLRANGAFPRFIEVGSDVWDQAYDWHVVNRRSAEVTRVGDRYQMPFLHSTLVLRQDATAGFIGMATDVRQ